MIKPLSLPNSLQKKILFWLAINIIIALSLVGFAIYYIALSQANELSDYHLTQSAYLLADNLSEIKVDNSPTPDTDSLIDSQLQADLEADKLNDQMIGQAWDKDKNLIYNSSAEIELTLYKDSGLKTITYNNEQWRVFNENRKNISVQIAQPLKVRNKKAFNLAINLVIPFLALFPIMLITSHFIVKANLKPLHAIANTLDNSDFSKLQPLASNYCTVQELHPIYRAINELLARLGDSINKQQALIADAAHELRSPLTALKLQVQLMERSKDAQPIKNQLTKLNERINRTSHLIEQLLTLAYQEVTNLNAEPLSSIDINSLIDKIVEEYEPTLITQHLTIHKPLPTTPIYLVGREKDFYILFKNLIVNAIKYTPKQGSITLQLQQNTDSVIVNLIDTGKGITATERERVFDRFYRCAGDNTTGSGLGLAIVKKTLEFYQASIELMDNPNTQGLWVKVCFPNINQN